MAYITCHCSHANDVHLLGLDCSLCDCILYRPSSAPDPLANDHRANANKLLSFARESETGKIKRLGAKIEGLLDNLAEAAEEEIAAKVAQERLEQERVKAIEAAAKARQVLEDAEAKLAELDVKLTPVAKRSYANTPKKKCDICGAEMVNVGSHKRLAHKEKVSE